MKWKILLISIMSAFVLAYAFESPVPGARALNRTTIHLEKANMDVVVYKLMDLSTGKIFEKAYDEEGNEVFLDHLLEREAFVRDSKYGKLDRKLFDILKAVERNERIMVTIWLAGPDPCDLYPRAENMTKAEKIERVQNILPLIESITKPIADRLRDMGFKASQGALAPFVTAELTPEAIFEIASEPAVVKIYGPTEDHRNSDYGTTTERATFAWLEGIDGRNTVVCVHEDDGVSSANPYLSDIVYWKPSSPNVDYHATGVAGVIASHEGLIRGVSYHADTILSANFQSFGNLATYDSAALWAINSGADVINMSWGGCAYSGEMNDRSRWVDYLIKVHAISIVTSAGNTGNCGGDTHVGNPANAYNVIAVGSMDDHDNGFWSDDNISSFSQYVNPVSTHSDREKPEIVALGEDVLMLSPSSPWTGYNSSGTSFSSPAVAGAAALLMNANSSLKSWPEAVKAILMASAFHNIEGPELPNSGGSWTAYDDKDGAGEIVVSTAVTSALNSWYRVASVNPSSFDPSGHIDYDDVINATVGDTWRVVLCWDATATGGPNYTSDTLNADLDLIVLDENGTAVATSNCWDNSYEICQFVATSTQNYTVRVSRYRFDPGTFTYMAVAWARKEDVSPCSRAVDINPGDTLSGGTYKGSMFWDTYNVSSWNESGREIIYRLEVPYDGTDIRAQIFNNPYDVDIFILNGCDNDSAVAYGNSVAYYADAPAGTYYLVVDGYNGAISNFDITVSLIGEPNLTHYLPAGWSYPVVPRDTTDTSPSYAPLPPELPSDDTTYLNMIGINNGTAPTDTSFTHRFYVDGVPVWWGTWGAPVNPGALFHHANAYVMIKGGRHTIGDSIDVDNTIAESDEGDNYFEHQFVWKPIEIQKEVPFLSTRPPDYGSGAYPNCDGYVFQRSGSYAYGVGISSTTIDEDYDLKLYTDYSGSESGFSVTANSSFYGTGFIDFVVAGYSGTYSTIYPGVIKFSGGNDTYYIDATDSQGRLLTPPATVNGEALPPHRLLNVYEVELHDTAEYHFYLTNVSGNADLGFALYGPDTGYYGRGHYVVHGNSNGAGGDESFTYAPTSSGWYVLAVYKNSSADEALNAVYDLQVYGSGYLCGDVNADGGVNYIDLTYLANYLFGGGPAPTPYMSGDVNGDCTISISDLTYFANYLFAGGPAPNCCPTVSSEEKASQTKEQ
ncbi:MAG: S8 family serine peptidase [Candidatus Hydrothermae bacterium]|nr:S8 family serine peptidase [Candidatus Hydrothermae bacterium]